MKSVTYGTEMIGSITALNISLGGVPKSGVPSVLITAAGLTGDRQRNLKFHGGPDRAVCLLAQEVIDDLVAQGHPIRPGSTGENLTIAGLDWSVLEPGSHLLVGSTVVIEITSHAKPCSKIAGSFRDGAIGCLDQKLNHGRSRLYARVLTPGTVAVGDPVVISA